MILYPAIDLKDGQCVRLYKGRMEAATVFSDDPAGQARAFAEAGARWLHVVDLNGAFAGKAVNGAAVAAILQAVDIPVQLGGGIRSAGDVAAWLDAGIARVVLGTLAVKAPEVVREASLRFPGRIAVGIDARGGKVAVEGWAEESALDAIELARRFEDAGVAAIIYTDIDRDGALTGPNLDALAAMVAAVDIPIIASGGVAGIGDIERLGALETPAGRRLAGAITGRALYEGRIDLAEALALPARAG